MSVCMSVCLSPKFGSLLDRFQDSSFKIRPLGNVGRKKQALEQQLVVNQWPLLAIIYKKHLLTLIFMQLLEPNLN